MEQSLKYTGTAAATTLTVTDSAGEMRAWVILDAFGDYPAITAEEFQVMSQQQKIQRKNDFLFHLGGLYGATTQLTEVNEFIIESSECDPEDIEYIFTASLTFVNFGVGGGTIEVEVVSTANDKPAPYVFTQIEGLQITQISNGLRITALDSTAAISGVVVLTQERRLEEDGVIEIEVSKLGAILYAGGWGISSPPDNEIDIRQLATKAPANVASPFVLVNPQKSDTFEFAAPTGTMTASIVIPAMLGAPVKVMSLEPGYDMTALFELASAQVSVDEVLCNVYYCTGLLPFAGNKRFRVTL